MHPYPPPEIDWEWYFDAFVSAFCPLIVPAVGLLIASIIIVRKTKGERRLTLLVAAVSIAFVWPLLPWPVVAHARDAARRTACRNNLQAIADAVLEFHNEHTQLPAPAVSVEQGAPASWRVDLLQYVPADLPRYGNAPSYSIVAADYDRTSPWDASANLSIAQRQAQLYRCPANATPQDSQLRWFTAYAFLTGPGTAFPEAGPLTFDDITDGTSNTLLVVEACGRNIVWTEPRDVDVSREAIAINSPGAQPGTSDGILSSYHKRGAQAALSDGSVRMLSAEMDASVLRALTTVAEGDAAGEF